MPTFSHHTNTDFDTCSIHNGNLETRNQFPRINTSTMIAKCRRSAGKQLDRHTLYFLLLLFFLLLFMANNFICHGRLKFCIKIEHVDVYISHVYISVDHKFNQLLEPTNRLVNQSTSDQLPHANSRNFSFPTLGNLPSINHSPITSLARRCTHNIQTSNCSPTAIVYLFPCYCSFYL